jgi:DNA-binding FadR family transcriptional regulator
MGVDLAQLVQTLVDRATPEPGSGRLRLPTERDLTTSLEISRGTLREHLSTLEMLGFVDRTQGRGSYLQIPDASFLRIYFDLSTQLGHLSRDQLDAARVILEVAIAESAARLATADDIDGLRGLVDEMVAASGSGHDARAHDAHLEFHRRLYRIADNPIFTMLHDGLSHVLRDKIVNRRRLAAERAPLAPGRTRITDTVHYGIVDALDARDGEQARAAVRRHFDVWSDLVGGIGPDRAT